MDGFLKMICHLLWQCRLKVHCTQTKPNIVSVTDGQPLWMQKFRPLTIDECILPEHIKSILRPYGDINVPLQHLILNGPPGAGKTTAGLAIANERDANVLMISASKDGGIDTLRNQIYEFATTRSLNFDNESN